ncbi:MAG: hypothetical protein U1E27_06370 [Kiritimatiellia bacterium]|nr:hypothetical protein [Kiritimatiellia bacterium]
MKRDNRWQVTLIFILIALAAAVYYIHFLIFRDAHHIFLYFVGDVGFVFVEVLLVTLVIHRLLHHREQKALRNKLNMLIGAFFSETGTELLGKVAEFDADVHRISPALAAPSDWSEREFLNIRGSIAKHESALDGTGRDLESLKDYLLEKKPFLLDLLQNPNLQENEPFTNLVWAVYHLTEELLHRGDLKDLPPADRRHLIEDIQCVYPLLTVQWMDYMKHLRTDYPHRFSLASRTNPFDKETSVTVHS